VSIVLEPFSVTASQLPSGENWICAGPEAPAPVCLLDPGIGSSPFPTSR